MHGGGPIDERKGEEPLARYGRIRREMLFAGCAVHFYDRVPNRAIDEQAFIRCFCLVPVEFPVLN